MNVYKLLNHPLEYIYKDLVKNGISVLDLGCLGFKHYKKAKELNIVSKQYGVDYADPSENVPDDFVFKTADLNKEGIPFDDDMFELVFAQHIIEHLVNPIEFVSEALRVCKPGGHVYIEAPSERALVLKGMSFNYDQFRSISFFDDPTHFFRPWTAQSFFRLAQYFSCIPVRVGYIQLRILNLFLPILLPILKLLKKDGLYEGVIWAAKGWSSYIIIKKPLEVKGKPRFNYFYPASRLKK